MKKYPLLNAILNNFGYKLLALFIASLLCQSAAGVLWVLSQSSTPPLIWSDWRRIWLWDLGSVVSNTGSPSDPRCRHCGEG